MKTVAVVVGVAALALVTAAPAAAYQYQVDGGVPQHVGGPAIHQQIEHAPAVQLSEKLTTVKEITVTGPGPCLSEKLNVTAEPTTPARSQK